MASCWCQRLRQLLVSRREASVLSNKYMAFILTTSELASFKARNKISPDGDVPPACVHIFLMSSMLKNCLRLNHSDINVNLFTNSTSSGNAAVDLAEAILLKLSPSTALLSTSSSRLLLIQVMHGPCITVMDKTPSSMMMTRPIISRFCRIVLPNNCIVSLPSPRFPRSTTAWRRKTNTSSAPRNRLTHLPPFGHVSALFNLYVSLACSGIPANTQQPNEGSSSISVNSYYGW